MPDNADPVEGLPTGAINAVDDNKREGLWRSLSFRTRLPSLAAPALRSANELFHLSIAPSP